MLKKKKNYLAALLYLLSFVGFLTTLYLFSGDFLFETSRDEGAEQIAILDNSVNDIRVKGKAQLEFAPAKIQDRLYHLDTVFSGDSSYAKIKLNTGGSVKLSPNSLITLRKKSGRLAFNINKGGMLGRVEKSESINISSGKSIQTISGQSNSKFVINKNKQGQVEVRVIQGTVEVKKDGKKQEVSKNQVLVIEDEADLPEVQNVSINLLSPIYGSISWFAEGDPVKFLWSVSVPTQGQTLTISRDQDFTDVIYSQSVTGDTVDYMIEGAGTFYWKMSVLPQGKSTPIESSVSVFTVKQHQAPRIAAPLAGSEFMIEANAKGEYVSEKAMIPFEIEGVERAQGYILQIAAEREFDTILEEKRLNQEAPKVQMGFKDGQYFARAKAVIENGQKELWSQTVDFSVSKEKLPLNPPKWKQVQSRVIIPNIDYPEYLYRASFNKINKHLFSSGVVPAKVSWPDVPGAESYDVAISKSKKIRKQDIVRVRQPEHKSPYIYPTSSYSVSLRSIIDGQESEWSEAQKITYELEPPKALSRSLFEDNRSLDAKGTVNLKWTPLLFAKGYEVFISRREDFRGAKSFLTKRAKYNFMIYYDRSYFWKVRAIDKNYKPISGFSSVSNVLVKPSKSLVSLRKKRKRTKRKIGSIDANTNPEVAAEIIKKAPLSERLVPGLWFRLGSGVQHYDYSQSESTARVGFKSVEGPNINFQAGTFFNERWGASVGYRRFSTEVENSGSQTANWQSIALNAHYKTKKKGMSLFGKGRSYQLVGNAGVLQQSTPFFLNINPSTNTFNLVDQSTILVSVGGDFYLNFNQRWRYEMGLNYQHPLSSDADSASNYEVSSKFILDGKVGVSYRASEHFYMGAYWNNYVQKIDYNYTGSLGASEGSQDLNLSNFDLKLGLEY